jgi:hypothetical protein
MKILLPLLVVTLALCACSTNRPASVASGDTTSDGPTLYGQLSISLDHTATR